MQKMPFSNGKLKLCSVSHFWKFCLVEWEQNTGRNNSLGSLFQFVFCLMDRFCPLSMKTSIASVKLQAVFWHLYFKCHCFTLTPLPPVFPFLSNYFHISVVVSMFLERCFASLWSVLHFFTLQQWCMCKNGAALRGRTKKHRIKGNSSLVKKRPTDWSCS